MNLSKIIFKMKHGMLIEACRDEIMIRTRYRSKALAPKYKVVIANKNRMIYYKQLKKKYYYPLIGKMEWEKEPKENVTDFVWIFWWQGFDAAPEIVKKCYQSVISHLSDKIITFLDKNNLYDYIELPQYIKDKVESGIIPPAHFSDLVRLELLRKYGGYWLDATVYCTDNQIFGYIDQTDLFMYSWYYFGFSAEIMLKNNWLIHSSTNNDVICLMQRFLYDYWEKENCTWDYFIFQIFTTIAFEHYSKERDKMPIVSQVDAHILSHYMFEEYNQLKFDMIKSQTGIHKLSVRYPQNLQERKNTFYEKLIKQSSET